MAHKIVNGQQVELTADEIAAVTAQEQAWNAGAFDRAMADLRAKRNQDLKDSDWTQVSDTTLTADQKTAWRTFRTELRNITDGLTTVDDVNGVDYPDKPTE